MQSNKKNVLLSILMATDLNLNYMQLYEH